ncbi:MAG: hypothetical protein JWP14_1579 [Frankiales bacterium]|nr:hypothetical protein [Frankiales bacterium]
MVLEVVQRLVLLMRQLRDAVLVLLFVRKQGSLTLEGAGQQSEDRLSVEVAERLVPSAVPLDCLPHAGGEAG